MREILVEKMTPDEIDVIKLHIAQFLLVGPRKKIIDVKHIQTWLEAHGDYAYHERRKQADFLVNYRDVYDDEGNIDKLSIEMSIFPPLECSIAFYNCSFNGDISIREMKYKNHLGFYGCEFKHRVSVLKSIFDDGLKFIKCDFLSQTSFSHTKFLEQADFSGSSFAGKANFSQTIFGNEKDFGNKVSFKHCVFSQGVDFSKAMVCASIYFNHAKFFGEIADFHESQFDEVACFYGVIIGGGAPNFSQVIFNGNLNFVNTKIMFDFEGLRDFIVDKADKDKELSQEKREVGWREKTANDYRDSFRLVKNNLLKNNNALDASQYHKMELYCKEIELVARIKEAIFPPKIKENRKEKTLSSAEQSLLPLAMDFLQLWFYRKTSDHHTDLLRIIAWVVACIGLFGYVLLGIFASDKEIAISWFGVSEALSSMDSWIVSVGCLGIVVACLLVRWVEWLVGGIGLLLGAWIFLSRPSYLIDLFKGSLLDGCFDRWQNATLLVHVVLLGLLLFSLQKTARKNTIIPS